MKPKSLRKINDVLDNDACKKCLFIDLIGGEFSWVGMCNKFDFDTVYPNQFICDDFKPKNKGQ